MATKSKVFLIAFLVTAVFSLPYKVNALANPAATSCVDSGGDYQIVSNPDGSQDGKCVYLGRFECSSYEYWKGNGCLTQQLIFGSSSYLWTIRLIFIAALTLIIYLFYKRFNHSY